MHDQELAIVRSLVSVAWADGEFAETEQQMLGALLDAYGASPDERAELATYAKEKRTLDDIDLQQLSAGDRRLLLQHSVLMSFADGEQAPLEQAFLGELATKLKIPESEAKEVMQSAAARAKQSLGLL